MSYCKKCGIKLDDDTVFCPNCGTPVASVKKDKPGTRNPKPNTGSGTMLNPANLYGRADPDNLPEGYVIDERYKIIEKLGQGSFGTVYLAYDLQLEINKVLKIIPEAVVRDKEAMLSLRKEAAIMVKLNHKNIVRVYDFHHTGGMKYIDMEYVEGKSLADLKLEKPGKKFTEKETKLYALQIAEGLSYAHNKKVIHKDIKPQNIMLSGEGEIKIMDFGIAETVHSSMSRLKNTGTSGTLVYMSPEQLRGKDVGKESDIYSLGATLYELLTGNPPFYQGDIGYQIINEKPASITGISEEMNAVVLKCLEKDKQNRFSDCEELSRALATGKTVAAGKKESESIRDAKKRKEPPPSLSDKGGSHNKSRFYFWGIAVIILFVALYFVFGPTGTKKEITFTSDPSGASLIIDRQNKGITPVVVKVAKGEHRVQLKKEMFHDTLVVIYTASVGKQMNFVLNPKIKNIAVTSEPKGATLTVDGQKAGITPLLFYLPKGVHRVLLQKALYFDTLSVVAVSNEIQKLHFVLKQKTLSVQFSSVPQGAKLYIDGSYKGTTPLTLPLDLGTYRVKLQKENYFETTASENISAQSKKKLHFVLITKEKEISSVPAGAKLFIDGSYKGTTPLTLLLDAGTHRIKLQKENYFETTASENTSSQSKKKLHFVLKHKPIKVKFSSMPQGAGLYVDDSYKGTTPLTLLLDLGTYRIKLQKENYFETTVSENISVQSKKKLHFALKQKTWSVPFSTIPRGAKLYIDGNYKGTTSLTLQLDLGTHRIKFSYGPMTLEKNILISPGSKKQFHFVMTEYTETADNLNLKMVFVKGGTFQMGSPNGVGDADEHPQHKVTVSDFYIGKYEVTQKQWEVIMGNNPSEFKGCENCPVEGISWNDVQDFIKKLNEKTGQHYLLPTEAEWEYAARGGNKSKGYQYAGSNNINEVAWYDGNSHNKTDPLGQKQPNELDIYDMSGNVGEWCNDWYSEYYYRNSPQNNPQGSASGKYRVLRGGSWVDDANGCRVANRGWYVPDYTNNILGFRVVHPAQQ